MSSPSPPIPKFIGARVRRREDPKLLTGRARFVADIQLDNMAHLALWRSPMAHAEICGVDSQAAAIEPGVIAVFEADAVNSLLSAPLPAISGAMVGRYRLLEVPQWFPLAAKRVRFFGEPVVAILAETPEAAADALDLIHVELDPEPVVLSPRQAQDSAAPRLHSKCERNRAFIWEAAAGDADRAMDQADTTVDLEIQIQRLVPNAMEPRAVLASYDASEERFTIWSTTQIPHQLRGDLAKMLGLDPGSIRVIAPEVGGGFGAKANVYPEEVLAPLLARRVARPVRWVATRSEDAVATTHGRDQHNRIRLGATRDGKVQAVDLAIQADCGAYLSRVTAAVTPFTGLMVSGVYDIPHVRTRAVGILTNKPPLEPYRGAGRPEAAYLIERAMDALAAELELEPAEIRRRNFVAPDKFPYRTALGLNYDSGNYHATLEKALDLADYVGFRRRQGEARRSQSALLGIGLSCYVEICGFGPWEAGTVQVEPDGQVVVRTGTSPHGQGHQTSWAQVAAELLQVPLDSVQVRHGDTDEVREGIGTFGSRSAPVGGMAVYRASEEVREGAKAIAAHLLEAAAEDLRLADGKFFVVGVPDRSVSWQEVAATAHSEQLPESLRGRLISHQRYAPQGETYPFGAHVCTVEVDPDTGLVKILRYLSVDDCGRVINPLIVEGQVQGGAAQGIGQGLWEEAVYGDDGILLSGNFTQYAMPRADSVPAFESHRTETPSPLNPLGVKGIGEAATIGSTPAVVNAVVDALSHLGVRHLDTPLTPAKIWRILRQKA